MFPFQKSVLLILLGLGLGASQSHAIDHDNYEELHGRTLRGTSENQKGVRTTVIRRRLHEDQNGTTHDISTNQRTRHTPGNTQSEKTKTDYVNNESRHHVTTFKPEIRSSQRRRSRPEVSTQTKAQTQQHEDSNKQKQIVKKNAESDFGLQPIFAEGTDYITNFNLNPINIEQLNIPHREKQILQGLSINSGQYIQNPIPTTYQQSVPDQFGYKIGSNIQIQPIGIQGNNQKQLISNDQRFDNALRYIHSQPEVKQTIQNLPRGFENVQERPRIVNKYPNQIPLYTSTEEYTKEYQGYQDYQEQHPELSHRRSNLSSQNNYPLILVDPDAKLGLPFYPSSKEINKVPNEEYNYEGIPMLGPSLEGKRYNNENQTQEEKEQERRYLLGLTSGLGIPPPVGYTRETIWQAGDPDADPQPEELTLKLNETCAYITWNETIRGTEDHSRPNIWQAGDYSAQLQEEELIRSANITCENYNQNILENVTGPYTILDYCWQCVKNDGSYIVKDYQDKLIIPQFIPDTYGPNNKQMNQNQQVNNKNQNEQYDNYQQIAENYGLNQNVENIPVFQQSQQPMSVIVYPNLGYRNDPENQHLGIQRRSTNTNKENNGQKN